MEKTLTITPAKLESVLKFLQVAESPKVDTTLGIQSVQEICATAQCMAVSVDGVEVGAYALKPIEHSGGVALWVMAVAGSFNGASLVKSVGPAIEAQAKQIGAKQICFTTKRRGLVKLLQQQGYEVTAVTLRKTL